MSTIHISGYEWDLLEDRGYLSALGKADWYYLFLSIGDDANLSRLREFFDPTVELLVRVKYHDFTRKSNLLVTDQRILRSISLNIETLQLLSPREFEMLTAEMLAKLGYKEITLGPGSSDGGVDVTASVVHEFGTERILVQCKKYGATKKVGLSTIKQLLWEVEARKAARGLIITTSTLTKPAKFLVESYAHKITAVDMNRIDHYLKLLTTDRKIEPPTI